MVSDELASAGRLSIRSVCHGVLHVRHDRSELVAVEFRAVRDREGQVAGVLANLSREGLQLVGVAVDGAVVLASGDALS